MSRFYFVCEFTPSYLYSGRIPQDSIYGRVYPGAPEGFLFHDTENALGIRDILRPLRDLSALFEGATKALVLRHDDHSLVATFSLAAFPTPARRRIHKYAYRGGVYSEGPHGGDWLQDNNPQGWLISDVNDPTVPPTACAPNDIFDQCTRLSRFAGNCPCTLLKTGECATRYLYPNLPSPFNDAQTMRVDYLIDAKSLKRVRYKNVADFELISGALTVNADFTPSVRPWDDHDFSLIEARRRKLSVRGKVRHLRDKFRQAQCAKCCFADKPKGAKEKVVDCGQVDACTEATSSATAWGLIYHWYKTMNFESMPGFTPAQRDYLIQVAGRETSAKAISAVRRTRVIYAGFRARQSHAYSSAIGNVHWHYHLAAAAGDLQRSSSYGSWSDLKKVLPELPETIESTPLPSKVKLACAIFGSRLYGITEPGKSWYPLYKVALRGSYVVATGTNARYESTAEGLDTDLCDVKEYFARVPGLAGNYKEAPRLARERLMG